MDEDHHQEHHQENMHATVAQITTTKLLLGMVWYGVVAVYLILSPTSGWYILPPSEHSTKEARACPKMDGLVPRTGITLSRR